MSARAPWAPAGALLAAAPLAAFLSGNGYPLTSPEAAVLLVGAAAVGALASMAARASPRLGALVLGAGLVLCLDFLYGSRFSKVALVLVPLACVAFALALQRHIALIVAAASSTFVFATLLIPSTIAHDAGHDAAAAARSGDARLPVLLHIVLDEHIGLDGVPRELPQGEHFSRWLSRSYVAEGFRVYAGAYSEYFDTRTALANLLNFTSHDDPGAHLLEGKIRPYVLARSAYFRHLSALGYALRVYQSDHIDFCSIPGQPYAACVHYRSNSIAALNATALERTERAQFILNSFFETSAYYTRVRDAYGKLRAALPGVPLPAWAAGVSRVGPLAVLPVIERLQADLGRAMPGEAYFAHLLIPHYPYMLDESCRPREGIAQWLYNVPEKEIGNTAHTRAERYERYFAQIRCQQVLLERLFNALKSAGVWDRAIVVVHGDHGSRIVRTFPWADNAARLTRADFNDAFSTLFAVRRPGVDPGEIAGARPLQALLAEALDIPLKPLAAKVYLRSHSGKSLLAVDLQRLQ
jgi:hypothetical protein